MSFETSRVVPELGGSPLRGIAVVGQHVRPMLQRGQVQCQKTDANHRQPKSVHSIMYFAFRAASPRNPKELLDRAAKGDERGRRSDPRQ
jgi:hypothetical protein